MWMGSIRSSSRTFRESCCCDPRTALCSLRLEYDFGKRGKSLSAVPVIQVTGVPESPTQLAPADEAAFNDLFVGKRAATDFPTVYADFVSPGRFRETRFLDIWAGSYTYRNTGSDTGTVTINPDVTFMTSSNIAKPQAQRAPKTTYRNSVYAPMVGLCSCAHRGEKAIMIGLHGHQAPQKCHIRVNPNVTFF